MANSSGFNKSYYEEHKALADELDNVEREELRKTKFRQQLMESPEIKALQLQLRTAYTRKELQSQLDEKKLEKMRSCFDSDLEMKAFNELINQEKEEEFMCKQRELIRKMEYRKTLEEQMINKFKDKQKEFKESLKERDLSEAFAQSIFEEDQKDLQRQMMEKEQFKKDIESFKQAKAIWLTKEKQIEADKERQIKEYLEKKDKEEEELKRKLKEKQDKLLQSQEFVANILNQNKDIREEHTKVIQLIVEEKEREKSEAREIEEKMKEIKSKELFREAVVRQIEERFKRIYLEKLEEEEYIKKKMEEYEEDKKYQQMTAQKQRLMKLEYRLSLQKEFEEKEARRKTEKDQLLKLKKFEEDAANERIQLLEEERIKLLQDHAVHVLGFLPPGLIQPSDLPNLPPDVREFYSTNPEPMGNPAR